MIQENVADFVNKPKKQEYKAGYYNRDELKSLFETIKGETIEIVVLLSAHYGLRRSEALGLRWDNIDYKENKLYIKHKCVRTFDDNGKLTFSLDNQLKSTSSYREFPLNKEIIRAVTK